MCNPSQKAWNYEYLVVYTSVVEVWLLIQNNRSLSPDQIVAILQDYEQKQGCESKNIRLGSVASLKRTVPFLFQPQPQQPYWKWRKQQGLPYSHLDVLQSSTVLQQELSPTVQLFLLGQMLVQTTFTLYREKQ